MSEVDNVILNNIPFEFKDSRIGELSDLLTTDKTSIVDAINEIIGIDEIIGSGVIE